MRACRGWGLALFVVLSVTTLFITPGAADDLEGVSQGVHAQLVIVDRAQELKQAPVSLSIKLRARATASSPQQRSANLLDLVCVRLC
jgi:hypothetical protein